MMSELQKQLHHIANARRREIIPHIYQTVDGRVHTGPFKNMTIVPKVIWGDGDIAAKLLGIYEDELHQFIIDAGTRKPDLVINVGCAEGYYAIGMARMLPESRVIAVDIDNVCAEICQENSDANNTTNVQVILKEVDTAWLSTALKDKQNPLIVMDCEGAELTLLDFNQVPELIKTSVLVECHDCIIDGITYVLTERFKNTHTIVRQDQTVKDSYQFDFLRQFSDCDKWALVHEGRPSTMSWLYMVPKQ
jgi:hypothetical protein